jgi:flagellar motor switch/type III secretory pathway protein FliN
MTAQPEPVSHSLADDDPDVTLRLELGGAAVPATELAQIQPGHIVPLDTDADGDVVVMAGDTVAARGKLVLVNGQICVQLSQVSVDHLAERD